MPWNIWCARRRVRPTSWSIMACPSAAPRTAASTSVPSAVHHAVRRRPAGAAHLRRGGPHRPRDPAHALWAVGQEQRALFFIEYFAIDLIMSEDGEVQGVLARARRRHALLQRQDDRARHRRLWPGVFLGDLGPYLHRRWRRHGWHGRACRCRTWNSCSSTRPASMAPAAPHHRGRARRLSHQFRG